MQNTDDNIDLDALFDMLNIAGTESGKDAVPEVQPGLPGSNISDHQVPELSPLDDDIFTIDLPIDQS
jgi:hypothetical protein